MAKEGKQRTITVEELLIFSLATADAMVELLMEKGVITESEFKGRLSAERERYKRLLQEMGFGRRASGLFKS